jgi:hypothetical protein
MSKHEAIPVKFGASSGEERAMVVRRSAAVLLAAAATTVGRPVHARTGPCDAVHIVSPPESLGAAWRSALENLGRATGAGGLPWSCPGGSVELAAVSSGGATLTVTDAKGHRASRHVNDPDEVVPTGEALLSAPLDDAGVSPLPDAGAPAPPGVEPRTDEARSTTAKRSAAPMTSDPRARLGLAIGPRVSGPGAMAWGSAHLRVDVPIGPWSVGFWARYDVHLAGPSGPWDDFRTSSVSAAVDVGREIISHPFELRATLAPSIAVVMMEAGQENMPHPEGAKPAFRLCASLRALFRIAGVFRGVVALDGEFAPAAITGLHNIDTANQPPQLPAVPAYTAGLLLGAEATLR